MHLEKYGEFCFMPTQNVVYLDIQRNSSPKNENSDILVTNILQNIIFCVQQNIQPSGIGKQIMSILFCLKLILLI